jgi:hypothetical protein
MENFNTFIYPKKKNMKTDRKSCNLQKSLLSLLFTVLLVLAFSYIYARVGGAGGSSSGGGGGDGLGGLILYILFLIPFPYNIIVIAILIAVAYYANKKAKQQSILNKLPTGEAITNIKGYNDFIAKNPGFNEAGFKDKVKTAFIQIQEAWQNKDMSKVRKYISDGMYQRLNVQFKMMDKLSQKNTIDKLDVKNIYIDRIDTDGLFDVVHVAIHASIVDKFISEKYSELNSGGSEEFVEYWSFMKKRGVTEKNLFSSDNCPSCGAALPAVPGEVAKCEFCGTLTNSGEYDWVLAEITQADDYISSNPLVMKATNLQEKILEIEEQNDDVSVQLIEDKASNAFLQVETARVLNDPTILRRFTTDKAFEKIKATFGQGEPFVYNRIYLSDVTLIGAMQKDNLNTMVVSIKYSYQRVIPKEKSVVKLDAVVVTNTTIVLLSRSTHPEVSKGSLYAHRCPSCGGPTGDTIDLKCQFCGHELNSPANEWILSDFMSLNDYYSFYAMNAMSFAAGVKPDLIDKALDVRDYAFNNALIIMAADGVFAQEERDFAEQLAKKFGYNVDKIEPMFRMAQNGELALKMPEDQKKRVKVFKLMEKAAAIDGNIDPTEQQILDNLKQQYGLN